MMDAAVFAADLVGDEADVFGVEKEVVEGGEGGGR
jgi:hypothetical protein